MERIFLSEQNLRLTFRTLVRFVKYLRKRARAGVYHLYVIKTLKINELEIFLTCACERDWLRMRTGDNEGVRNVSVQGSPTP